MSPLSVVVCLRGDVESYVAVTVAAVGSATCFLLPTLISTMLNFEDVEERDGMKPRFIEHSESSKFNIRCQALVECLAVISNRSNAHSSAYIGFVYTSQDQGRSCSSSL